MAVIPLLVVPLYLPRKEQHYLESADHNQQQCRAV